jgi:hypothetical protein
MYKKACDTVWLDGLYNFTLPLGLNDYTRVHAGFLPSSMCELMLWKSVVLLRRALAAVGSLAAVRCSWPQLSSRLRLSAPK